MNVVFLVTGYIAPQDKQKSVLYNGPTVLYNGPSAVEAFDYFTKYSEKAEIVVSVYENGQLVRHITESQNKGAVIYNMLNPKDYKKYWEKLRRTLEDTDTLSHEDSCKMLKIMNSIKTEGRET